MRVGYDGRRFGRWVRERRKALDMTQRELAEVQGYLSSGEVRLLTLTGPPGVGKTRLAVQAAANLLPGFRDGVFFVGLAPVRVSRMLFATISQALGLKQPGDRAAST